MMNGATTFDKNAVESIRKKREKSDFFGIFRNFSGFFGIGWTTFGNFWIILDNGG
jgi:hypothetical protein